MSTYHIALELIFNPNAGSNELYLKSFVTCVTIDGHNISALAKLTGIPVNEGFYGGL